VQQSGVNEYERCKQSNATARPEEPPQQVYAGGMRMINNALWIPEHAVELQLRLCVEAHCALQDTEHTKRRFAQSRSMWHGQRWRKMSRSLCRTVCSVSLLFLETKCHARWVRSYMRPSPTRSCTSTSCTSGCQEAGKYQYLLLLKDDLSGYYGVCRVARLMLQPLSTH
jgi:hypothetical protein